jgi:peptidoglycan/LPS O-acetylase OafA/YrhL
MRYFFHQTREKEKNHMNGEIELILLRVVMALMGAVGCVAFGCAVAGVDTTVFTFGEAAGMIVGLAGVFFSVLMLMSDHHGNKFHKM